MFSIVEQTSKYMHLSLEPGLICSVELVNQHIDVSCDFGVVFWGWHLSAFHTAVLMYGDWLGR